MILKTRKKVHEVMFFDMKKYLYSESLFNALYIEIKHMIHVKNFLRTKETLQKMHSFFFRELQRITVYLRFLYELKHKVHFSKTVCAIFHFPFHFVVIKVYIFVQENTWTR